MTKSIQLLLLTMIFLNIGTAQMKFQPPETKKIPVIDELFNLKIVDNYRWLEDKDNPETKSWSEMQHKYTVDYIKNTSKNYPGLKDEIKNYIDRDYHGAPFYKGDREFFYSKKKGDQQYKIYTILGGKELLIFDPLKLDPSGNSAISGFVLTEDGNKAAVGIQFKGDEINVYRIIDTKTGEIIGQPIKNVNGFSWTKDEKHAYITYRSKEDVKNQLPLKTFRHKIGEDSKNDIFLIAPNDAKDWASVEDDDEADYTFYSNGDFYSCTLKIKPLNSQIEPKQIYSSPKFRTSPIIKKDKIYFFTNDNAPNFKVTVADLNDPEYSKSKPFIPESEDVLNGMLITPKYIFTEYKKDVLNRIFLHDLNGKKIKELELPEIADVAGMSYHKQKNVIFVTLTTFTSAAKVYKLDANTLKWEFIWQDKPPIATNDFVVKQIFYPSKDGTKIPMFIVHKKGIKLDGTNPTLLYGYGGFNISMGPSFLGTTAMFINRGGVYALACLRGGNEYGEKWHNDGMLFKKQNTFDDFISAAEYLISEKFTSPSKLSIKGGSNGGLLIGATITQRPELFKAAICGVPLLDMIRFHKFLIARYWIPEYGDPDKEEDFKNIIKYSPYHNIKEGINYPTTLFECGENDTRVDPLHAKKMVAKLRANPGQINPILLHIDFDSGHGSGQSVDKQVNSILLQWEWLMTQLNM